MENFDSLELEKQRKYEDIWIALQNANGGFVEIPKEHPKHDFLGWLLENKNVVLHGSNNKEIDSLEPRAANCAEKESGNQTAIYAVKDSILPIFYAIKDKDGFRGRAVSGIISDGKEKRYGFEIEQAMHNNPSAFSDGAIYVLDAESFTEQRDDDGDLSGEFVSLEAVKPLGKIMVSKDDFPYFSEMKVYKKGADGKQ